jgi:hypothetical protein
LSKIEQFFGVFGVFWAIFGQKMVILGGRRTEKWEKWGGWGKGQYYDGAHS